MKKQPPPPLTPDEQALQLAEFEAMFDIRYLNVSILTYGEALDENSFCTTIIAPNCEITINPTPHP